MCLAKRSTAPWVRREKRAESLPPAGLAPDAQAEPLEVDVFTLVGLAGAAAIDAGAEEGPHADRLAGVVVAVGVAVAFEHPAPGAALAAGVGLLLPTLEDPRYRLQRQPPGLRVAHVDAALVERLLGAGVRQRADRLEQAGPQRRRPPRGPEVERHPGGLERQAVEVDPHPSSSPSAGRSTPSSYPPRGAGERAR